MFMYDTIQKTIAAWAFNHYIAYYYFDNVNVNQLKVAFEKGEVELEGLPIKKDALQHLNLPMEVVEGFVGRLSIKVPLLTLLSDPWVIKLTDLMLIVTPVKQTKVSDTSIVSNLSSANLNDISLGSNPEQFANQGDDDMQPNNGTEEAKLAEFYTSFSTSVSSMVRDIYKNIRLEIESVTILFEEFDHGLAKLSLDRLLMHRPKSVRNLSLDNVTLFLSSKSNNQSTNEKEDLLRISIEKCNFYIHDEASHNMQLVSVADVTNSTPTGPSSTTSSTTNATQLGSSTDSPSSSFSSSTNETTSEIKCEGNLKNIIIEELINPVLKSGFGVVSPNYKVNEGVPLSKRNVLNCDNLKLDFKLSKNMDLDSMKLYEKNLQIKLDMIGMKYIHSQRIFEIIRRSLETIPNYILKLNSRPSKSPDLNRRKLSSQVDMKTMCKEEVPANFNKLYTINIEHGLIYVVDDVLGPCAIPLLEITLEDCRILQFSGPHQQNGFVFAKIGCNYYNRQVSVWNKLLKPWPFSMTWDLKSSGSVGFVKSKQAQKRLISLTSDEVAEIVLSRVFLDLCDVALKRVFLEFISPKFWPTARSLYQITPTSAYELNSIFVLHNETGHRIFFAPLELNSLCNYEIRDSSDCPSDVMRLTHKLSINSQSSRGSSGSPDLISANWITVDAGESLPFHYETLPIYRRHISDFTAQSRALLVRVEGWKTLLPISIDKTGLLFREACSDRVANEDTFIAVSIDLEPGSARKIISIRSPLNLVNSLDATVEVHFEESNQALYIKPDSHLAVPLPYLYNKMHIRPCNVGVTMSKQVLLWDDIVNITEVDSRMHICHPITVTNQKHASYSTSRAFRICVSTQRCRPTLDESIELDSLFQSPGPIPVFTMSFLPPLTIINLIPFDLKYSIGKSEGVLHKGSKERVNYADTTRPNDLHFEMEGFPRSRPIYLSQGDQIIEMFDTKNRSLNLRAKITLESKGEEPALQVTVYAPYWFINKTGLPLVFKQEGAASDAAGQFESHEEKANPVLLFSFYDVGIETPWLCTMRLGKSEGISNWCDGFILEKGSGERRLHYMRKSKVMKHLLDINVRKGFGRFSDTTIATFNVRYGFDPLTKTPKKAPVPSPQNYKLTSFNHSTNLSERIAGQAVNLFNHHYRKAPSDVNLKIGGFKLTLVDDSHEKLLEASFKDIVVTCHTKAKEQVLDCSIGDIRIENALSDCDSSVMLDRVPNTNSPRSKPALRLIIDRILGNSFGTILFKQVQLSTCELILNIEEKLILKLVEFLSFRNLREKAESNLTQDLDRNLNNDADRRSKYYFDLLRIDLSSLQLSVFTSSNLSESLTRLKSHLGLKFFSFEGARLQLAPYFKMNVSRTFSGVFESVTRFYKKQLLDQAPRIVGQQIQNYLRFHLSDLLSTLYDEVYHKLFN